MTTIAHIHDTTIEERELLKSKGVKMVACPSSIGMIDGIVPPAWHYYKIGGIVGLGRSRSLFASEIIAIRLQDLEITICSEN